MLTLLLHIAQTRKLHPHAQHTHLPRHNVPEPCPLNPTNRAIEAHKRPHQPLKPPRRSRHTEALQHKPAHPDVAAQHPGLGGREPHFALATGLSCIQGAQERAGMGRGPQDPAPALAKGGVILLGEMGVGRARRIQGPGDDGDVWAVVVEGLGNECERLCGGCWGVD
ncbi:uncharacterized protein M421DRAFT_91994 [Didymella exigua CBS 183.55]|uniref:Uncharacterized protein n=1 Tax=Didymella exigua CBS 183.55 TaxID=1150837 RepID=A0A6A5RMH7_9PLEO|nr:uncharacterized protein M421DRAFT_91994 [Didymella exigua CBS 183.55]KAF1928859.1 hypothetical protein M421DRAFT_91994 [Didymella exigua CBS 183.55]